MYPRLYSKEVAELGFTSRLPDLKSQHSYLLRPHWFVTHRVTATFMVKI